MGSAIERLRELEAQATKGPWKVHYYGEGQTVVVMPRDRRVEMDRMGNARVYGAPGISSGGGGEPIHGVSGHELDGLTQDEYDRQRLDDGNLIAAARNELSALLDVFDAADIYTKAPPDLEEKAYEGLVAALAAAEGAPDAHTD